MNKKEIEKIVKSGSIDEKKKLVELLDSENPETAEFAQDAIIKGTEGQDKKELVKKLMDTAVSLDIGIRLRSNAFDVLKRLAMHDGNFLIDFAGKNKGKYDRITAELIRYGKFDPADLPKEVLKTLASSSDEITKANAMESIGILKINLGGLLIKSLKEVKSNFFVLSAAVFAVGELKLKKAFPALKELFLKAEDRVVKNVIIESLSKIGGDEIINFLLDVLKNNVKYKLDKVYILKGLYKLCIADECSAGESGDVKTKMYIRLSKMNLKMSLYLLNDYEEKDAIDAILCYFSIMNHKKSQKLFQFIFEYYKKNESLDENEYKYIKEIIKKLARPKFITEFLMTLSPSSEYNDKMDILIDVLSEDAYKDIIDLLVFYADKKLFVEVKILLLKYSAKLSGALYERRLIEEVAGSYIGDANGDVRKYAVKLVGNFQYASKYIEKFFENLLKERYADVIDAYVETLSNFAAQDKNGDYIKFFIKNISSKNDNAAEYALRILSSDKISLNAGQIADFYSTIALFKNKPLSLKRLLAKSLGKFDLIKHKDETAFLFKENDEETRFNYLESLLSAGEKKSPVYLDALKSGGFSEIFRYKVVELIQKTGAKDIFDKLASLLPAEKSKMVKIALLKTLHVLNKEKSNSIIKKYNSSKDKDIKNFSIELING